MKLRDRTKRVLSNLKQEDDHKPAPNTMAPTTCANNDANTFDLTIKQEETKERKSLSKQDGDLDEKEYRYQCDLCKIKMANLKSVLDHRTSIHEVKQIKTSHIKNIDVEPDVHEPNFYCRSCERGYSNTKSYRQHLRQAHFMNLKLLSRWKTPKNVTAPDPNDPSLYCRACDHTYKSKSIYKTHCQYTHGLNPANANRTQTSSTLTDSYCQACDKRLSSIDSYRRHLFVIHKVDARPIQQKQNDIIPNVNDPNFYCRSCEKKLVNIESFRRHLMTIHSIFQSAPRKKSIFEPDVNDPNLCCRACQRTYSSKYGYRVHLRTIHQMPLPRLISNAIRRTDVPDPFDPYNYCNVCNKSLKTRAKYRRHCHNFYFMVLGPSSIVNPKATIDVNDPDFHCAQCERLYASKTTFKNHLRRVHRT